jgi:hypothetical protein
MQNDAEKNFFGFAKTSENEAKQDAFRFISLRSENEKRAKKGHPRVPSCAIMQRIFSSWPRNLMEELLFQRELLGACVQNQRDLVNYLSVLRSRIIFMRLLLWVKILMRLRLRRLRLRLRLLPYCIARQNC